MCFHVKKKTNNGIVQGCTSGCLVVAMRLLGGYLQVSIIFWSWVLQCKSMRFIGLLFVQEKRDLLSDAEMHFQFNFKEMEFK